MRRNLRLKIFSLLLALLLWMLATGESQKVKDLQVPLQFTGLSAGLDLSGLGAGDQFITLSPDRFRISGATVIRVEPPVLEIRIVRQAVREVPVVPRLEGKPPEGYEVVDYRVVPPTVAVVGPDDAVREVRRATTGSIPVDALVEGKEFRVYPVVESGSESRVRLRDPGARVRVRVTIRERSVERVLRDVPLHAEGASGPARIRPEAIDIRIAGPASLVGALDRGNLRAEVSLRGLPPRDREYRVAPRITLLGVPGNRISELEVQALSRMIAVRVAPEPPEEP